MPTPVSASRPRRARRPQIVPCTGLVPLAAAREIVDECSRWLGVPLPARYASSLAFRAHRCFAHSPSFRAKLLRPGPAGRDRLWMFLRHWLSAHLAAEQPHLYRQLPASYAAGADLPERTPVAPVPVNPPAPSAAASPGLSPSTAWCW